MRMGARVVYTTQTDVLQCIYYNSHASNAQHVYTTQTTFCCKNATLNILFHHIKYFNCVVFKSHSYAFDACLCSYIQLERSLAGCIYTSSNVLCGEKSIIKHKNRVILFAVALFFRSKNILFLVNIAQLYERLKMLHCEIT